MKRAVHRSIPRGPLQALGLPGARLGSFIADAATSPSSLNSTPENLLLANLQLQERPEKASAACACGLGGRHTDARGRLPPTGHGRLELPDSSTTSGRSLVSCLHVVLSEMGRGGGPRSLSARTTTPASPVGERPGRRRLGGSGARGVASPGPRPPLPSSAGRQLLLRPEREPKAGGRSYNLSAGGAGGPRTLSPPYRPRPRTWWPPAP